MLSVSEDGKVSNEMNDIFIEKTEENLDLEE